MACKALEAGTATIARQLTSGAKLPSKTKAKPVLVAAGKLALAGPGTDKVIVKLTAQGRKLLKKTGRVRLLSKIVFRSRTDRT